MTRKKKKPAAPPAAQLGFVWAGADALDSLRAVADVLEFASTDGFPGFMAWLDRHISDLCDCGHCTAPSQEDARKLLKTLLAKIRETTGAFK